MHRLGQRRRPGWRHRRARLLRRLRRQFISARGVKVASRAAIGGPVAPRLARRLAITGTIGRKHEGQQRGGVVGVALRRLARPWVDVPDGVDAPPVAGRRRRKQRSITRLLGRGRARSFLGLGFLYTRHSPRNRT